MVRCGVAYQSNEEVLLCSTDPQRMSWDYHTGESHSGAFPTRTKRSVHMDRDKGVRRTRTIRPAIVDSGIDSPACPPAVGVVFRVRNVSVAELNEDFGRRKRRPLPYLDVLKSNFLEYLKADETSKQPVVGYELVRRLVQIILSSWTEADSTPAYSEPEANIALLLLAQALGNRKEQKPGVFELPRSAY